MNISTVMGSLAMITWLLFFSHGFSLINTDKLIDYLSLSPTLFEKSHIKIRVPSV